ncbi:MAG: hypothetical protein KME04_07755 [Pleurocapsa minor GSE-CHR-MK-17-07R]|jgi:hypothetical protein|nr:hypothetical protein [Pleurocapsa minor GSE-CHR-MK 17-07R]
MSKFAVVVLSDTGSEEGFGRVFNAMTAVQQLSAAGHEVGMYFDGTGTRWLDVLADERHPAHGLFASVYPHVVAACSACASFFNVQITSAPATAQNEVDYSQIAAAGNQVLTF